MTHWTPCSLEWATAPAGSGYIEDPCCCWGGMKESTGTISVRKDVKVKPAFFFTYRMGLSG